MIFIAILVGYATLMVVLGAIASRRVRAAGDFFVAGRSLSTGLIFSTFLAANIGAGSTVGATGLGYRDGLSAWWWVGSAGIGSLILAFTVGPRIWRVARDQGLYTVGDYLEFRYDRRVRGLIALLLWAGSLAILAGQLIAIAFILNITAGIDKTLGCIIGAAVATAYFAAGGLAGTARVNALQVAVKLLGFILAFIYLFPVLKRFIGDPSPESTLSGTATPEIFFNFFGDGMTPLKYLILLAPSFVVSPGLLQKIFGARDERAVTVGVALNAICLLGFAIIPAIFGMMARSEFPGLENRELALPTLLTNSLPTWLGGLLLGAIFAAEVSTADAVLFMLTTSLSKDLYQTFIKPAATEGELMRIARLTAVACGVAGTLIAALLPNVISALTIFYTLLSAALTLPLIFGLYWRAATAQAALVAMLISVATTLAVNYLTDGAGYGGLPPLVIGITAGALIMIGVSTLERLRTPLK
jgi:SSS family solute:Na+ symporter